MPDSLDIALNRDTEPIAPTQGSFETTGTFTIRLRNAGQPVHVHLRLEGELARVARVEAPNHYVAAGGERSITVQVKEGAAPVGGKCKIVTGYGQETAYVAIQVLDPAEHDTSVTVDESLAEAPARERPEPSDGTGVPMATAIPVVLLAALATALAIWAAVSPTLPGGGAVRVGAVATLVGVLLALFLLIR